jgi:hypothetical protein
MGQLGADCTAVQLSDIASKDLERIVGTIAKCLAANSPYINLLSGGTFASGISDEVRSIVQMPAAPGDSLAEPKFDLDTELCGTVGQQDLTDVKEFKYFLEGKRGFGPRVCVKKGYSAFKDSYLRSEDALAKLITQYINSDIRAQTVKRSASKFTVKKGLGFYEAFEGGEEDDIGIKFAAGILPDAAMTFKGLHKIARFLKEALFADMWPAGEKAQAHFRVIAEEDIIEAWRNELDVKEVMIAFVNGSYKLGETALSGYSFSTTPAYRGLAFASDQRPLRALGFNPDGTPQYVNPVKVIKDPAKNTAYSKVNPQWLTAPYGILQIFAENTFERQVPERYIGEGSFKFAPQLHSGELDWHYQIDNDCNVYGDFGWHKYQITRAYRPIRPQHVVSVFYKRCVEDLGFELCSAETLLDSDDDLLTTGVAGATAAKPAASSSAAKAPSSAAAKHPTAPASGSGSGFFGRTSSEKK